jgi:hypothetical protein
MGHYSTSPLLAALPYNAIMLNRGHPSKKGGRIGFEPPLFDDCGGASRSLITKHLMTAAALRAA